MWLFILTGLETISPSLPLEKEQETSLVRANSAQHPVRSRAPETAQEERTELHPDNHPNHAHSNPFLPKSSNFLPLLPQHHHSGVAGPETQQGLCTRSSQPRNRSNIQASPGSSKGHPLKKRREGGGGEGKAEIRGEKKGGEGGKREEKRGKVKNTLAMRGGTRSYFYQAFTAAIKC